MTKKVILISGGQGRLASELRIKGEGCGHRVVCLDLDQMDITDKDNIDCAILEYQPDVFMHCAAILDNSQLALETNILGTVNVVLACQKRKVKLIYLSTDYVYSKAEIFHVESNPLLPFNIYGWTKLGGECAVRTYSNSLIIRGAMCPCPYPHKEAYTDVEKNLINIKAGIRKGEIKPNFPIKLDNKLGSIGTLPLCISVLISPPLL